MILRRRTILGILLVAAVLPACGPDRGPASDPPAPPPAPELVSCPVEGTRFEAGRGVMARAGERVLEVCSNGCRYRVEVEPEKYAVESRGR